METLKSWVLDHEPVLRLSGFLGVFVVMAAWELAATKRALLAPKAKRWVANLSLTLLNTVILRAVFPIAAIGAAAFAADRDWGLLNWVALPEVGAVIAAVIALDLCIYFQHRLMHAVPILWRLHRVHHADSDFDVTTGSRFHPLEILVSMAFKLGLVLLIGPSLLAVLLFEILLNASSMFNHANVRLPRGVDARLRLLLVTPDMHRVHHSSDPAETNRNFGFSLPWWDRMFGTYQDQPRRGHEAMKIGLQSVSVDSSYRLFALLWMPFLRTSPDSTIDGGSSR